MAVEISDAITIPTFSDWLKILASGFQPMRINIKSNRTMYAPFSSRFQELFTLLQRNSDWFMALFAPVGLVEVINFVLVFRVAFGTVSYTHLTLPTKLEV